MTVVVIVKYFSKNNLTPGMPESEFLTTNESERILENLGKNERIRIRANLGETGAKPGEKRANLGEFGQKMGNNGQKMGERNRILAKQGETESFAETLFGFGHPWCRLQGYL